MTGGAEVSGARGGDGPTPETADVRDVVVDDEGIHLVTGQDRVVDYLFDGRRIGSFWLVRDTEPAGAGRVYRWPRMLVRHLDGATQVSLVDHVAERELYAAEVRLGSGEGRVAVEDPQGNPLGVDKSGRLMRLFDSRSSEHLDPLLDAVDDVLTALEQCGVEPFLAYGTLLGAVRDGRLIGHDSDADLGYVSHHDHPVDAIRESFRLQRLLVQQGYRITRYSGLAFKIVVEESDGARRGLDVFGGFQRDGHLYLMGEVGAPFREEWLRPRSEVTLEGRTFPAPAQPAHLLEAMYGPSWQVPDPAFKFTTPVSTQRRLNGWFRGTRVGREELWDSYYHRGGAPTRQPASRFVRWVAGREPDLGLAVDVGCGTGRDVAWLARQGVEAVGLDYVAKAYRKQERKAQRAGLSARYRWTNLNELRSVLVTGAELAREPGPRVVLARHVADATNRVGRDHLFRLARMVTRDSGRLYLQVRTAPAGPDGPPGVSALDVDALVAHAAEHGGRLVEHVRLGDAEDRAGGAAGVAPRDATPTISRLVIQWNQ